MTLPRDLVAAPFHVREALAAGVSRSRLRARELSAPYRGVRAALAPADVRDLCAAYLPLMGASHCFSHSTAASLWGMWLPRRLERPPLHVIAPLPARAPRMSDVVGHKSGPDVIEIVLLDGLPVASPLDTWRQLSSLLSVDELIEAGDSLVRRQGPLVAPHQLPVALARHGGCRGVRALRTALPEVRAGCDSPRETRVRLILTRGGLPEPRVNPVVSAPDAARRRFGDMVYEEWRVIVEYDGGVHRDPRRHAADVERLEELARDGWIVIRVLAEHLSDPASIVRRVETALRAHGWER